MKIRNFQKRPGMSPNRPTTSPNTSGSCFACITLRKSSWRDKTGYCKRSVNVAKPFTRDFIFGCPAGRPPKMSRFYVTKKCNAQKSIFPKWSILDSDRLKIAPNDPNSHSRYIFVESTPIDWKNRLYIYTVYYKTLTYRPNRMSRFCVTLRYCCLNDSSILKECWLLDLHGHAFLRLYSTKLSAMIFHT